MSDEAYPELGQFLGGYFHEDSYLYGDSWERILDHYLQDAGDGHAAMVELDRLLATTAGDDDDLHRQLRRIGLNYLLPDGLDERTWLTAVRARLERAQLS